MDHESAFPNKRLAILPRHFVVLNEGGQLIGMHLREGEVDIGKQSLLRQAQHLTKPRASIIKNPITTALLAKPVDADRNTRHQFFIVSLASLQ